MSDYAAEGGEFMVTLNELTLGGFALQWHDRLFDLTRAELTLTNTNGSNNQDGTQGQGLGVSVKSKGRSKFHCTECRLNAWAKPSATLVCGDCNKVLEAVL